MMLYLRHLIAFPCIILACLSLQAMRSSDKSLEFDPAFPVLANLVDKVCLSEYHEVDVASIPHVPDCESLHASFIRPLLDGMRSVDVFTDARDPWASYRDAVTGSDLVEIPLSPWTDYTTAFFEYMDTFNFSSNTPLISRLKRRKVEQKELLLIMAENLGPPAPLVRKALGEGPLFWNPLSILKYDLYEFYRKEKCTWISALIDDSFTYSDLYTLAYEMIISNSHLRCLERLIEAFPILVFAQDSSSRSLLHWAVLAGNPMASSFLVRAGADYCLRDTYDRNPPDYAKLQSSSWQVRQFLEVLGRDCPASPCLSH